MIGDNSTTDFSQPTIQVLGDYLATAFFHVRKEPLPTDKKDLDNLLWYIMTTDNLRIQFIQFLIENIYKFCYHPKTAIGIEKAVFEHGREMHNRGIKLIY